MRICPNVIVTKYYDFEYTGKEDILCPPIHFLQIHALKVGLEWSDDLNHSVGIKPEVLPLSTTNLTAINQNKLVFCTYLSN